MNEMSNVVSTREDLEACVTIGPEAYTSKDYARSEVDRLWRKVWLQAGRIEDLPNVGDFVTYQIVDDSVVILRTGPETLPPTTTSARIAAGA